jgi:hypothetical protein
MLLGHLLSAGGGGGLVDRRDIGCPLIPTFIPKTNGAGPPAKLAALVEGLDHQRVRVATLSEALAMSIPGQIVRKRETMVNGSITLSLVIQFDEVSTRVRGAFLAFAEGTGNFDKARNETGQD